MPMVPLWFERQTPSKGEKLVTSKSGFANPPTSSPQREMHSAYDGSRWPSSGNGSPGGVFTIPSQCGVTGAKTPRGHAAAGSFTRFIRSSGMKSLPRGSRAEPTRATKTAATLAWSVPLESLLCATEASARRNSSRHSLIYDWASLRRYNTSDLCARAAIKDPAAR